MTLGDKPDTSVVGTIIFVILLLLFIFFVPQILGLTWPWL